MTHGNAAHQKEHAEGAKQAADDAKAVIKAREDAEKAQAKQAARLASGILTAFCNEGKHDNCAGVADGDGAECVCPCHD